MKATMTLNNRGLELYTFFPGSDTLDQGQQGQDHEQCKLQTHCVGVVG